MNDALQAQEYYLKAYEVGKKLNNPYLLGRLCANLGTLYTYQELYQPAMAFQKEAVDCFLRDEDTVSLSVTFRNIARIHVCESRLDSAIVYYSKALLYTSGSHEFYMLNELKDYSISFLLHRLSSNIPVLEEHHSNHRIHFHNNNKPASSEP